MEGLVGRTQEDKELEILSPNSYDISAEIMTSIKWWESSQELFRKPCRTEADEQISEQLRESWKSSVNLKAGHLKHNSFGSKRTAFISPQIFSDLLEHIWL